VTEGAAPDRQLLAAIPDDILLLELLRS